MLLLCQYSLPVNSITPVLEGLAKDGVILNRLQIIKTGLIFTAYKRSDEFVFLFETKSFLHTMKFAQVLRPAKMLSIASSSNDWTLPLQDEHAAGKHWTLQVSILTSLTE